MSTIDKYQTNDVVSQSDLFIQLKGDYTPADRVNAFRATKDKKLHREPGPKPKDVYYKRAEFRDWASKTKYAKYLTPEGAKLPDGANDEIATYPQPASADIEEPAPLVEVEVVEDPAAPVATSVLASINIAVATVDPSSDEMDYNRLNGVVREGLLTFIAVGLALKEIHDRKLYVAGGYKTWGGYCKGYGELSKNYSNRLIVAAKIYGAISEVVPKGTALPYMETQVRPLALLDDPAQQADAWGEAVKRAGGGQPTGKLVAEVVAEKKGVPDVQPPTIPEPEPKTEIARSFNQILEAVRAELPHQEIEVLLVDFGKLIGVSQPTSSNQ